MLRDFMKWGRLSMVRKTFSFTDMEVIKWLEGMDKGEMSRYIQRLIREDMRGSKDGSVGLSRDDVIKIIKEFGVWVEKDSRDGNKGENIGENNEKLKKAVKGLIDW
jgi:predicted class III extradiol MEMO1 family dioxygenase